LELVSELLSLPPPPFLLVEPPPVFPIGFPPARAEYRLALVASIEGF